MYSTIRFLPLTGLLFVAAAQDRVSPVQARPQPQLSARELFYTAVSTAPKSVHAKAVPALKPSAASPSAASAAEKNLAPEEKSAAPVIAAVSKVSAIAPSLGLKYSILKKSAAEAMVEVPADTPFHAGDRIQLSVEANSAGYLYVISQGSSGAWKPMFPSPEIAEGDNRIEPFRQYLLPPKSRMVFDEQTGEEKLFVVFSREPEPSLEKMIYTLEGAPAAAPSAPQKRLTAANDAKIDNHTVGLLRAAYSRDLVIEKVDASAGAQKKETAVYVVNPSGSPDSRLVADLRLAHR